MNFVMIKTILSIIALSLLVGCTDPGEDENPAEVYIKVKGYYDTTVSVVVKVGELKWEKDDDYKCWKGTGGRTKVTPSDIEGAKAVERYVKSLEKTKPSD